MEELIHEVKVSESLLRVSSFEGGSSGSEAVDSATIEPYQYKPLGSHSSGSTDSSGRSIDEESAGAERLLMQH